jgi:AcrR family transcriptional regulator
MTQPRKKRTAQAAELEDWRKGATRSEKAELLREALFRAAAEVVGEVGYADASVALITARAGVGQGTFYNYFASRQDLFDQLLPTLGRQMRDHVRAKARGGTDFAERESLAFRAFFSFLAQTPHFFRILNEAESFAPNAHKSHFEAVAGGYLDFLGKGLEEGEFPGYEPREMEVVTYILMAARSYLAWRYVYGEERHTDIPEWVARAYQKFVLYGLKGRPQHEAARPNPKASRPRSVISQE